jgi:antitoxin (DNA-binding transcriptional repressor) of toxin-antitoxin stability system
MYVSATEFRTNVGKYLDLVSSEDIHIMKHGRHIATLSASDKSRENIIESLKGAYKPDPLFRTEVV